MITRRGNGRALALTIAVCLLAGCGGTSAVPVGDPPPPVPPPTGYAGVAFSGTVLGAATPIVGASVQLYSAGTSGARSAPTALLPAALTTDASGAFAVPAGYACASSASPLFLIARGGMIVGTGSANPTIALLLAVGPCGAIADGSEVTVNEISTVTGVWAMAQFLGSGGALGASATNTVGLTSAMKTSTALTAAASGAAGFAATGVAPVAKINALASRLHLCVADAGSDGCAELLLLTTAAGGQPPPDTLEVARNLALSPATHTAAIYDLILPSPAFGPALPGPPADWTLSVAYTGGGMSTPTAMGIDSLGDVWVASYFNVLSAVLADRRADVPRRHHRVRTRQLLRTRDRCKRQCVGHEREQRRLDQQRTRLGREVRDFGAAPLRAPPALPPVGSAIPSASRSTRMALSGS